MSKSIRRTERYPNLLAAADAGAIADQAQAFKGARKARSTLLRNAQNSHEVRLRSALWRIEKCALAEQFAELFLPTSLDEETIAALRNIGYVVEIFGPSESQTQSIEGWLRVSWGES